MFDVQDGIPHHRQQVGGHEDLPARQKEREGEKVTLEGVVKEFAVGGKAVPLRRKPLVGGVISRAVSLWTNQGMGNW